MFFGVIAFAVRNNVFNTDACLISFDMYNDFCVSFFKFDERRGFVITVILGNPIGLFNVRNRPLISVCKRQFYTCIVIVL